LGGQAPEGAEYACGFFFAPTLIDVAGDDSLPMSEETYGPLAAIRKVKDDKEALKVANALPLGFAAYVYSRDLERAWAFAERIESGTGRQCQRHHRYPCPFRRLETIRPGPRGAARLSRETADPHAGATLLDLEWRRWLKTARGSNGCVVPRHTTNRAA
jgi:hypothetical protein